MKVTDTAKIQAARTNTIERYVAIRAGRPMPKAKGERVTTDVATAKLGYTCLRCGHITYRLEGPPDRCGKCKSPYWNRLRGERIPSP